MKTTTISKDHQINRYEGWKIPSKQNNQKVMLLIPVADLDTDQIRLALQFVTNNNYIWGKHPSKWWIKTFNDELVFRNQILHGFINELKKNHIKSYNSNNQLITILNKIIFNQKI